MQQVGAVRAHSFEQEAILPPADLPQIALSRDSVNGFGGGKGLLRLEMYWIAVAGDDHFHAISNMRG